ncbi:MAG: hypothetical protein A2445_03395 [Candidatus Jacksonbacteria bacterium RIFOXYC2_FULL_44_29]|nr:MAG: FIST domain protein [Parcubacteria group bacterium GW2011_GWC2_44_22]OGY76492.1 MAG: hypothetical protein A2240_04495 [Candidatus Jacksonbacteria bacterium RIFOXYA2_FULL_43_12]OGY77282.1 MAG: hypothetical protein A2295_04990 [Candidatus Jacksonbacteria bacterium RIFOXYB2_FULL_44_15]OGY78265.1 MAG: hypothetical protein A2445_03395 [Candidatus Jacksonbacteria bacterium RIFOXYC2_FULL_44_29]OGY78912.1 MAG: hypothetical protein A2550_05240 [Candidatus Jacksonbacteria bacterium RIFOXYD2_FULL_
MPTKVGVGKSKKTNSFEAGVEAAELALKAAGLDKTDLVFVVGTVGYEQDQMLKGIKSLTKEAPLVGFSVAGIVTQDGPDEDLRVVGVMAIASDEIKFKPVFATGLKENSHGVGQQLAEQLKDNWPENAKLLITLPDGLGVNSSDFFKGLETNLPTPVPFVGGASGGLLTLKDTYQYFGDQVLINSAVGLLLSGDFSFATAVSHGALATDITHTVTKAEGNHVYEINGKPAFDIFREYVGEEVKDLNGVVISGVCMGIRPIKVSADYEDVVLRIPLRLDSVDGSLYMSGEMPVGTEILVCERKFARIMHQLKDSLAAVKDNLGSAAAKFVWQFDCIGRGQNLMGADAAHQEIAASQDLLGKDVPWLGCYTFGEIAPVGQINCFHNWTNVLLVIY